MRGRPATNGRPYGTVSELIAILRPVRLEMELRAYDPKTPAAFATGVDVLQAFT